MEEDKKKPFVLTGDLNVAHKEIDIYDPKGKEKVPGFTPEERDSFDTFLGSNDVVDTFRYFYPDEQKFTFWSARINARADNRGWRLDYFCLRKQWMDMVLDS